MKQSSLRIILIIAFVDLAGFGLIIPLQAVYARELDADGVTFGALIAIYAATQFIFAPILGRWSDRIGRRPILLVSTAGSVGAHLLLGFGDLYHSLPLLFVARFLDGLTGANIAAAQAYIADVTTPENRARGMGLFGAAFGAGIVVGPAVGLGLMKLGEEVSGGTGTSWPGFGAAAISLIAFALVLTRLPESITPGQSHAATERSFSFSRLVAALEQPRLARLLALYFTLTFAFVFLEVTFVLLCMNALQLSKTGTMGLFAYLGLLMVIVQGGLVGRLAKRFGEPLLVCVGPMCTAVGFALIALAPRTVGHGSPALYMLAACVPLTLGIGLTNPSLMSLVSRQACTDRQGATLGLAQGLASLARAVSPLLGGWLFVVGPSIPYWCGAGAFIVCGAAAWSIRNKQAAGLNGPA